MNPTSIFFNCLGQIGHIINFSIKNLFYNHFNFLTSLYKKQFHCKIITDKINFIVKGNTTKPRFYFENFLVLKI